MAIVNLHAIWINDAEILSDRLKLQKGSDFQPGTSTPGTDLDMAGGRIRAFVQGSQRSAWTLTAEWLTYADCIWLQAHEGRLVWVRDWHGRRVHGWWKSTVPQVHDGKWARIALSITEISPEPS